jgi:cytochrome c-type biogenesis protein CcmE
MTNTADWTSSGMEDTQQHGGGWVKFAVAGVVVVAAIALFLYTTTRSNAQFYLSVQELRDRGAEMVGKDARISGIVVPDSIAYDSQTLHLEFDVVDRDAANQEPLRIIIDGEPLPDQMKDEAEAIAEGRLNADGTFQAETLMMKCASKYEVEVTE